MSDAERVQPLEVACDESGNDGENLFAGNATVFVDASVDVALDTAQYLMEQIYGATRSQAPELKSATLLLPRHRDVLLALLNHDDTAEHVDVHLSEKRYFLVSKLVDLVIEEHMHELGENIYRDGRAGHWAWTLYNDAPAQLGDAWDQMLNAFNRLTRVRAGVDKSGDLARFRQQLEIARTRATGLVKNLLRLIVAGDRHLEDLARDSVCPDPDRLLDLHPVFAALGQAARTWHEKSGRNIVLIHDNAPGLTPRRGQALAQGLSPRATGQLGIPPVPLHSVVTVDSKLDARVQLADLFAGIGRAYAQRSLAGDDDVEVLRALRPHLNEYSVWADPRSWEAMMGHPLSD